MRRPVNNRKPVDPELKYSSVLIAKIINKVMSDGKKSAARKIVYGALEAASEQLAKPVTEVIETAIENVGPIVELKSRRVGGANYQVPIEVRPDRRLALAIRWIVDSARSAKGKAMQIRLKDEVVNAFNNTGNAVKKRADVQRMAEANKAFAHLAW
jgi:small subunit ribosomal protein S7